MVRAAGISRNYGTTRVLNDLNLEVARGESLGVSGANGSGRSTLMRVLATLIRPSSGLLQIDGHDCPRQLIQARQRIAYAGGDLRTDAPLTAAEYLRTVLGARGIAADETASVLARDLNRARVPADAPIAALSTGMRQRLALAAGLVVRSPLLILDDPLRGLDEDGRTTFLRWIGEARDAGTTVVMTSTDERDLTTICQRIVRLDGGRIAQLRVARSAVSSV
jgi:ABC-type multidrug transport system ATPase subunit